MKTVLDYNPKYSESEQRICISPAQNFEQEAVSGVLQISIKPIPESFFRGLADCDAGRVIDMEKAMNETPPGNA